jgi:hypothetical protein
MENANGTKKNDKKTKPAGQERPTDGVAIPG